MKKLVLILSMIIIIFTSSIIKVNASSASSIYGPDVIHKQQNHILTMADVLEFYHSPLGNIQVVEDSFTGKGNVLGTHTITLYATDNTIHSYKSVSIIVVSQLGSVRAVGDYKNIYLKTNQVLTPEQIVRILEKTGYITITATTQMMTITNTYSSNAETPGVYLFEFRLVNSAGLNEIYSSVITVHNDTSNFIPDIVFTPPKGALESIKLLFYFALVVGGLGIGVFYGFKQLKKFSKTGE
jgi:ABC-type cobalt transport system substrate-binding protein